MVVARGAGQLEQDVIIERLTMPPIEERTRSAEFLDVLEIQYTASVEAKEGEKRKIVDSSAAHAAPGNISSSPLILRQILTMCLI